MALPHDIFVAERRSADLRHQGLWNDEAIFGYFDAAVRQRPEHTAVVDYKSTTGLGEALTYEQLARRVEGIAAAFARRGVKAGDVISIQSQTGGNLLRFISLRCGSGLSQIP